MAGSVTQAVGTIAAGRRATACRRRSARSGGWPTVPRDEICGERPVSRRPLVGDDRGGADPGVGEHRLLDLGRLDPDAADLHLAVDPAEELDGRRRRRQRALSPLR